MDKQKHTLLHGEVITIAQTQTHSSSLEQLSTDTILIITAEIGGGEAGGGQKERHLQIPCLLLHSLRLEVSL